MRTLRIWLTAMILGCGLLDSGCAAACGAGPGLGIAGAMAGLMLLTGLMGTNLGRRGDSSEQPTNAFQPQQVFEEVAIDAEVYGSRRRGDQARLVAHRRRLRKLEEARLRRETEALGKLTEKVEALGRGGAPMKDTDGKAKSDEPKAEAPKAEEPKAEEPKTEAPKAEEPKAEEPKAEEPKTEAPKAEEPKTEAPKAEEPKAEAPKGGKPEA